VQYTEHYRIVTRNSMLRSEAFIELDQETTEAEALEAWDNARRTMAPRSTVELHRMSVLVVATASKG
jgi:hypothetical protein